MTRAPKVRARPDDPPIVDPGAPIQSGFNPAFVSRLLVDVPLSRHESIEFADNLFVNDLCGSIVQGEIILLAGAPGSNKSTVSRQLILDRALRAERSLMILTEEPAERAKNGFLKMSSDLPTSKVRGALSNVHVESRIAFSFNYRGRITLFVYELIYPPA